MPPKGYKSFEPSPELTEAKERLSTLDAKMKGRIAEGYTLAKLGELGFDAWLPYMNNHKTDIGVLVSGNLVRLQVKTATLDITTGRFRGSTTTRDKNGTHILYDIDTIDFFIFVCLEVHEFYVIPAKFGVKISSFNFYPHRKKPKIRGSFDTEDYHNAFYLISEFNPR